MATALVLAGLVGCGPIEYMNQVSSRAAKAVADARAARADKYAIYEYTAAEEYLLKAREEAGYSAFQVSIEYGRKAEAMARKARSLATEKNAASEEVKGAGQRPEPERTAPARDDEAPRQGSRPGGGT